MKLQVQQHELLNKKKRVFKLTNRKLCIKNYRDSHIIIYVSYVKMFTFDHVCLLKSYTDGRALIHTNMFFMHGTVISIMYTVVYLANTSHTVLNIVMIV